MIQRIKNKLGYVAAGYHHKIRRMRGLPPLYGHSTSRASHDAQESSAIMRGLLDSGKPCMIARYGSVELGAVVDYLQRPVARNAVKFLAGEIGWLGYRQKTMEEMKFKAGFFPIDREHLDAFAERMLNDSTYLDVLGSWLLEEGLLGSWVLDHGPHRKVELVAIQYLEPFWSEIPWTSSLAGKRMLVIHPFAKTIQSQYRRRAELFEDANLLPGFTLMTYKPVISAFGEQPRFDTWSKALYFMIKEISRMTFDVAIIGAGAYGFCLAAEIKRMGKQAIHLGGATQLLFGISGHRWAIRREYMQLINDAWVKPSDEERPAQWFKMEDGCYW
jgi:hypothetical protein